MKEYHLKTKQFFVGAIIIDPTALKYALWKCENKIKIAAVRLGVMSAVTAADTNYTTAIVKNATVTIASMANGPIAGGISIAAGAQGAFTLVTAAGANEVAKDALLTLEFTKVGNGLAWAGANVEIDYYDYND